MKIYPDTEALYQVEFKQSTPVLVTTLNPPIPMEPGPASRLVFLTDPHGLAVEQYKRLRGQLCNRSPRGGLLLVTSPSPADGKTLTSINLAWSLADAGYRTCLVDCDFRAPSLARTLELPPVLHGLTELLAGEQPAGEIIRQLGNRPLYVMPIGTAVPSSANQFASSAFRSLLGNLREQFKWVILDMAPAVPVSDVAEALPLVDGALLVVRRGWTDKRLILPSIDVLGAKNWGAVLNDAALHGGAYYGSYGYFAKTQKGSR